MSQNPEFFKAFPHLKPAAKKAKDPRYEAENDHLNSLDENIKVKSTIFKIQNFKISNYRFQQQRN